MADIVISEWGCNAKIKIKEIMNYYKEDDQIIAILEDADKTFLFEGYDNFFRSLIPRESDKVLAHCDTQSNNILASLENNTNIMLIDYEYVGWQPRAFDLANYINEMLFDSSYPYANGIFLYIDNLMN